MPSLITFTGGEASARRSRASRRPAAQVPPSRIFASGIEMASRPSRCRKPSATRSSSATVSARHSTTRGDATSCSCRAASAIAKREHAGVDEQSAVAIFGKAGQAIDIGDVDAGSLQRFDERIRQPLRELVQRYETAGRIRGRQRRMLASNRRARSRPASAAMARSARVAAAVPLRSLAQAASPPSASIASRSNRPPGRGVSRLPNISGFEATSRPSRRNRSARPSNPDQRIDIRDLHAAREVGNAEIRQLVGIGAQRL